MPILNFSKNFLRYFTIALSLLVATLPSTLVAQNSDDAYPDVGTIKAYNDALPYWGTTWSPDSGNVNGYHPSFYTGFAMRSESPKRIHIRQARGNQTRVTVVLDQDTIADYLFDLVKRDQFYQKLVSAGKLVPVSEAKAAPQLRMFNQVVNSEEYQIPAIVAQASAGKLSAESLYQKSLALLATLNPGRVFHLDIDLTKEFLNWRKSLKQNAGAGVDAYLANPQNEIIAIETLLWGRINYTDKPSDEVRARLKAAVELAVSGSDKEFLASAVELFKLLTGDKYQFQVVKRGKWVPALQCTDSYECRLSYSEFTAVYPTGSAVGKASDRFGNPISAFASPGLWVFYNKNGARSVDNIRSEPYYGWIPKMDYEGIGNGYHNPAVRFGGVSKSIKEALGADLRHTTLWAVMRGPVSHGCSRIPAGHAWEMRQILPITDSEVAKTYVYINGSKHFDVYDVDGNGKPEVIGVEYLIRYGLRAGDRREAAGTLDVDPKQKEIFYGVLYGKNNVFTSDGKGKFTFANPEVSLPSYLDFNRKSTKTSLEFAGDFDLYEQTYEKDKLQFYRGNPSNKTFIQLMGRIKGVAPASLKSSDKTNASAELFDKQVKALGL